MSVMDTERVRALGALRSLESKKKLAAETWRETHNFSTDEKKNESMIMLREKPLGQDSELKIQREQFGRRRKILRWLKRRN
jgi:hypothetical protein